MGILGDSSDDESDEEEISEDNIIIPSLIKNNNNNNNNNTTNTKIIEVIGEKTEQDINHDNVTGIPSSTEQSNLEE